MRGLVSSATFTGASSLRAAAAAPTKRVIAIFGDSNFAGFGSSADNATGFRSTLNRILHENGIRFRMVGQGYGGLNGAGSLWGRYPNVEDFHDHPVQNITDWRHWAFGGRRLSHSNAVTAIDASANTFTVPGHNLAVGVVCTLDVSATDDPPVLAIDQPVYYVASVSGDNITLAQFEGSTTTIDVTSAGSGTVRLNEGIIEMLPNIAEACDETPTDIVVGGGTNDVTALVVAGYSVADALAILKERELAYEALLDELFPLANKHRISLLDYNDDTASAIAGSAVALQFNAWLVARASSLGRLWTVVEATSRIPKSAYADIVHLARPGYEMYGEQIARSLVQSIGPGLAENRAPRHFVRRPPQACIELRATTDRGTFPAQTALNPGATSFFFGIRFMPFALPTGTNVIVQQENPYGDGCMLTINADRMNLYHKSNGNGTVIAVNTFTKCIKQYRWHDLFAFFDMVRQEAALFCNGQLLQRTHIGTATITSQDGWAIGAFSGLGSAPGLYQRFLVGHGASLSIEDALEMAIASYYDDADPPGTTYKALLADGAGTSLTSAVPDTTGGTLAVTTGGWVTSGRYGKNADDGFIRPRFDSRIANVTAAYTATYQELVKCDPSGAAFTITLPTAVGHDGKQIAFVNMTTSTNEVTLDGNASETINGSTTLPGLNTSRGSRIIEAREGNWVTVAVS